MPSAAVAGAFPKPTSRVCSHARSAGVPVCFAPIRWKSPVPLAMGTNPYRELASHALPKTDFWEDFPAEKHIKLLVLQVL